MNDDAPPSDYLVISRGQWDADASPAQIQGDIDRFYVWHARLVDEGGMKGGQRLAREGKWVTKHAVLDGPFAEAKEVVGGYWFITRAQLDGGRGDRSAEPLPGVRARL